MKYCAGGMMWMAWDETPSPRRVRLHFVELTESAHSMDREYRLMICPRPRYFILAVDSFYLKSDTIVFLIYMTFYPCGAIVMFVVSAPRDGST